MKFTTKYMPQSLDEVVYPSDTAEHNIKAMVPNMDRNLVLYGPAGTGKTTCAKLIPLEVARATKPGIPDDQVFYEFKTGLELNVKTMADLKELIGMVNISALPRHLIVIDEADLMSRDAMDNLKVVMDYGGDNVCWILCTNRDDKISEFVKSRCTVLNFAQFNRDALIERAKTILEAENCDIPDDNIHRLVRKADGDLRKLNQILQEVTERKVQ